jgi:hypothetical protein
MATFVLADASVVINSVDLSDRVSSVTLSVEVDEQEDTAMGDTYRSRIGGLRDWSVDIEFHQDFGSSEVDDTIWPLVGTVAPIVIKPTSGAVSSTNPSYSGNVLVTEYSPIDGGVGDLATTSVSWPGSGPLTRATS